MLIVAANNAMALMSAPMAYENVSGWLRDEAERRYWTLVPLLTPRDGERV
jgi:hypothetical protein